jgi:large subunit ribosomal protein L29
MKAKDLRVKKTEELKKMLEDLRQKKQEYSFNLALGKVKNVKEIHQIKKDIARIMTILRERGNL